MIVERSISWGDGDIRSMKPKNSLFITRQGHIALWIRRLVRKYFGGKSFVGCSFNPNKR